MNTPSATPLMTPKQVADQLGVHPDTVSRWARTGVLTAVRGGGGHRRFRREDVEALTARWEEK